MLYLWKENITMSSLHGFNVPHAVIPLGNLVKYGDVLIAPNGSFLVESLTEVNGDSQLAILKGVNLADGKIVRTVKDSI